MEDNKQKTNITVRLGEVTAGDTGTYWCGAKSNNSRIFFNKFVMTVGESPFQGMLSDHFYNGWISNKEQYAEKIAVNPDYW